VLLEIVFAEPVELIVILLPPVGPVFPVGPVTPKPVGPTYICHCCNPLVSFAPNHNDCYLYFLQQGLF
jgi:hypothetical protein